MGHSARRSEDGGPCRGSGGRHGGASGGPVKCGQRTGGLGLQCSGARGAQAAADALRRRQKANKAALTKKHAVYKSKIRLLQGLEKQKSAAPEVYVAPELNYVGHTGDEAAVSGDAKKCKRASGNDDVAGNVKYGGGKPEKSAPTSEPFESRSSEEDDSGKDDDVVNLSIGSGKKAAISGLSSDHPPKVPIPGSADGRMEMKRKFQPYQKELAIAAARQAEIDARNAKFARENEQHEKRRKKEAAARKVKTKRYRKVTRHGQPVMKHRVDALLERIERGRRDYTRPAS